MRMLLLQGANLEWLGRREPSLYGSTTADELDAMLRSYSVERGVELEIVYSNHEGEAIDQLYAHARARDIDAIVMNPGGFTYSGFALRDCIKGINIPVVEVHITNHYQRDIHSVTASSSAGVVMGFGLHTYCLAFDAALHIAQKTGSLDQVSQCLIDR
jgi:3-dehydroquinate dehydratase-2